MQIRRNKQWFATQTISNIFKNAGVGKSWLIKAITESLKQILRYPNQSLDQPSVLLITSTEKAAPDIIVVILHSALNVLIIDETSMTRRETFVHLDLTLKTIMQNSSPFVGVSLLVVGDFYNFHLLTKKVCSWNQVRGPIGHEWVVLGKVPTGWAGWDCSAEQDPDYAQLLKRVRER